MNPVHLSFADVALAGGFVLGSAVASLLMRLDVHRKVLWAAARMVVQLLVVGLLLRVVFRVASAAATLVIVMLMIAAAAREVAVRPNHRLRDGGNYRVGLAVVGLSSLATVMLALLTAIRPDPWYAPRYAIPLMGIVLGSVLNSASLGLDAFFEGMTLRRQAIEAQLALGYTFREATSELQRSAIGRGLIPIINQISAAGIITLPGIMTGQLLAGMDPIEAVKYQILLLFLLTGAGCMAAAGSVYLAAHAVTDDRQHLRMDRINLDARK